MYRIEDVYEKVRKFVREEFPEIASDIDETGIVEEITNVIYEMLVGEFEE